MFETDEVVNQLFDYSKCMVDSLTKKNSQDEDIKNILYLVFAGMVSYYGYENINDICKAFSNKFIYDSKRQFFKYIKDKNIKVSNINDTMGTFIQRASLKNTPFGDYYNVDNTIFIFKSVFYDMIELIDTVVHEYNHLLNSLNKPIVDIDSKIYLRCGLRLTSFDEKNNPVYNYNIEEGMNVLQTMQIVNKILYFSNFSIKDKKLADILNHIKNSDYNSKGHGYESVINLIGPLYQNSSFKSLVNSTRITGNVKTFSDYFDRKTYGGAYNELCSSLDKFAPHHTPRLERVKVKKIINNYLS